MSAALKLWRISQEQNDGYDTYDSAVVVAESEGAARLVHPNPFRVWVDGKLHFQFSDGRTEAESSLSQCWANDLDAIKVELIGNAAEHLKAGEVVCASFNAG